MTNLVLRGGRVLDPSTGRDEVADVHLVDGAVSASPAPADARVIDVTGQLVVPGLIDLHAHVFEGLGDFCVAPERAGVDVGVPTVVDGGTSGVATFDLARRAVIDPPGDTRVLAFIDPSQLYLATSDFICHKLRIAGPAGNVDRDALAASLERNADVVVGCKVRACTDEDGSSPALDAALATTDLPIMVHLGRFPHSGNLPTEALLDRLRPGDVITHAFRGAGGFVGQDGALTRAAREAIDRGVVLDIGHSATDFRFREARRLLALGVRPSTASTDLNRFNADGPVFSVPDVMTKLWALDLDLVDVVAAGTSNVARTIGRLGELGTLAPGATTVSVLRIEEGSFPLTDGHETVVADRRLVPVGCIGGGRWFDADADLATGDRVLAVA